MRQSWFSPFKTLWAVSGILITVMINLTSLNNGVFFILPYLIYNPQRFISFWRNYHVLLGGKGWEKTHSQNCKTCSQVTRDEIFLSVKTSVETGVWAKLIPWHPWRPQRGLVHLWAGAAPFRVRWRPLEDCRGTPQEYLLQIGSGPPPPLLKPLLSFLTTKVGWLLLLTVLCHCSTSKWQCCLPLRKNRAE